MKIISILLCSIFLSTGCAHAEAKKEAPTPAAVEILQAELLKKRVELSKGVETMNALAKRRDEVSIETYKVAGEIRVLQSLIVKFSPAPAKDKK